VVLTAVLWSTAGVAVATLASRVIYGLQEMAREARQLGQYVLEEKIGEGGMGEVYRARHAMLRRPTAVKLLSGDGSESQLRRFEKEVQLTARLTHPNTISIYDYGRTPEGVFYYAMELLDGVTLEQLVQNEGPQPAGRVIHLLRQVCAALKEAHGVGLIHRDIKPANIFLCRRGGVSDFVKVLDFGLVREVRSTGDVTRSNIDALVGTPLYMSPEAILTPDRIDARADIYGLGGVAYHLVTGAPPFAGQSLVELAAHHLHSIPPPPSQRTPVPDDVERVILSCLAKDPGDRPESAEALSRSLRACKDAETWTETDADAWWAHWVEALQTKPQREVLSAKEPQRTICCDLERRLRSKEHVA
jgi:serine/threonine-protein kinase